MSLAEPVSKTPALVRLANLLRGLPVIRFVLAGLAVLRGHVRVESFEPALLRESCGPHRVVLDPPFAAPPRVDQAAEDAPSIEVTVTDPPATEQAVDQELLIEDPRPSAPPPLVVVDQPDVDRRTVDLALADPGVSEKAVDDLPLTAPAGLNQPDTKVAAVDAAVADPIVEEQAADEELPIEDLPQAAPPPCVVDPLDAEARSSASALADPADSEPAVGNPLLEDLPIAASAVDDQPDTDMAATVATDADPAPQAALQPLSAEICAEPLAEPELDERAEREKLIRRRWIETGIKMWKTDFNGVGRATLNIQGCAGLLPIKPGETMSRYDTLQFRQLDHGIVCEGVMLEPPHHRK